MFEPVQTINRPHPLDLGPLIVGLLMITMSGLYLVNHLGWADVDPVVGLAACWVVLAAVALGRACYRLIARG